MIDPFLNKVENNAGMATLTTATEFHARNLNGAQCLHSHQYTNKKEENAFLLIDFMIIYIQYLTYEI